MSERERVVTTGLQSRVPTGPMGRLKSGMVIDSEWKVEDVYQIQPSSEWIWILKHLTKRIEKYLNRKDLHRLFTGKPGR